jgi:predicted peptidase
MLIINDVHTMNLRLFALSLGMLLMPESRGAMEIQPGKQLPQEFVVNNADANNLGEASVHYLLFTPRDYKAEGEPWPLLLFLHGLGECGNNELARVKVHGPPKLVEAKGDFPFVLVSPQCPPQPGGLKDIPKAWKAEQLIQLVDHVSNNMNIDSDRVYVTGLSMGAYGTWRLVAAYPERFAAAVPICGGGEPGEWADSLRRVPIWAFHGARDAVVPLSESEKMVDAVRRAGGDVRLTVYPEVEHDSWTQTYDNHEVYQWLLSHRRALNKERGASGEERDSN